jgi:hypothetical protein
LIERILNERRDFGIYSPWGDLTGRVVAVFAAYDHEGDNTTFRFLVERRSVVIPVQSLPPWARYISSGRSDPDI